jgi:hypothetical protein
LPVISSSHQRPRNSALSCVGRLCRPGFFLSGQAVEHEVVRNLADVGMLVSLGHKAYVKYGVEADTRAEPPPVLRSVYRTDRPQDSLLCAGYSGEER